MSVSEFSRRLVMTYCLCKTVHLVIIADVLSVNDLSFASCIPLEYLWELQTKETTSSVSFIGDCFVFDTNFLFLENFATDVDFDYAITDLPKTQR